jgi:hypothetical protein
LLSRCRCEARGRQATGHFGSARAVGAPDCGIGSAACGDFA